MAFAVAPELIRLTDLDAAWATKASGQRVQALVLAAEALRQRFSRAPRVLAVRTLPLTTLLYPTKFAFGGAASSPAPYVLLTHRALLVQLLQHGALKTLLFNPTDVVGAQATPYFRRMIESYGEFLALEVMTHRYPPLETQLTELGLGPLDIDYVAFDHFHTQDLRTLLGTTDGAFLSRFPNARLLAPRIEWEAWDDLHPLQRAWFVADGKALVRTDRVVLTEGDLALGDGAWLLRTPGHTVGNQTLFVNTESGIWGTSENGTSADAYAPLDSSVAGVAATARQLDLDVILNSNTPEGAGDQYASMLVERALADRVARAPAFVQMLPSSEVTPSRLAPLVTPRLVLGKIQSGEVVVPPRADRRAPRTLPTLPTAPPRGALHWTLKDILLYLMTILPQWHPTVQLMG